MNRIKIWYLVTFKAWELMSEFKIHKLGLIRYPKRLEFEVISANSGNFLVRKKEIKSLTD